MAVRLRAWKSTSKPAWNTHGGTGEEKVDVFAVQQSPGKQFPVRDKLNFIKEEAGSAGVTPGRVELVEYFDQAIEVLDTQVGEALVFKAEIEQTLPCRAVPCS